MILPHEPGWDSDKKEGGGEEVRDGRREGGRDALQGDTVTACLHIITAKMRFGGNSYTE